MSRKLKVLFINDSKDFNAVATYMIERRGHEVLVILGVKSISDESLVGLTDGPDVTVSLRDYDIAFVDGQLPGSFCGWDIVPHLLHAGLVCIASSSSNESNQRMAALGAQVVYDTVKDQLAEVLEKAASLRNGNQQ